jgi:hypothetical protein
MSTFNFFDDSNSSNPGFPFQVSSHSTSNLGLNGASGSMHSSHTGMNTDINHGFPTTSTVGALNIASNDFPSMVGTDTHYLTGSSNMNSLPPASVVELLKHPQAFERYTNWRLSERNDTLFKQNTDLQQLVVSLQQQVNTLKVEVELLKQNTKYVKLSIFNIIEFNYFILVHFLMAPEVCHFHPMILRLRSLRVLPVSSLGFNLPSVRNSIQNLYCGRSKTLKTQNWSPSQINRDRRWRNAFGTKMDPRLVPRNGEQSN